MNGICKGVNGLIGYKIDNSYQVLRNIVHVLFTLNKIPYLRNSKKEHMRPIYFLLFISIIILLVSCLDDIPEDFDNPESTWNPNFSIAVGYTSLGMNEESGFDTLLFQLNAVGFPIWTEEIDVPLYYSMPFDMQEIGEFSEEIRSIMFRINTYNGFPADAKAQIYFRDIDNYVVDSLFLDKPLTADAGTVIDNGETVNKKHSQTDIVISQDKIDGLTNVRNILVKGLISNLEINTSLIEYYPGYSIDIQLGVKIESNMIISQK